MTAVAALLSRFSWAGLTVYVAFLLTQAAHAAGDRIRRDPARGSDSVSEALEDRDGDPAADASAPLIPPPPGTPTPYGPLPPPAPAFRDTQYGAQGNWGPPGSPGYLHPHFPEYQTRYGIWYQPRAFHEPGREVYRPMPFRPRGWGNLWTDDPCRHDRMDYNRYVVTDLPSRYGPAYYPKYAAPSECLVRPERHYDPPTWGAAE